MSCYIPPVNYGMVNEELYRCGQPNELNFPFMEKLQLKTIIYLAPDDPTLPFQNFVDDQGIILKHMGTDGPKTSWKPMSEEVVLQALSVILEPKNYPLCVMCNLGRHRTGTVIGCLRKLQKWNLVSVFEEYRRFAGSKVRLLNEQFIELFDTDLVVIPSIHPLWLRCTNMECKCQMDRYQSHLNHRERVASLKTKGDREDTPQSVPEGGGIPVGSEWCLSPPRHTPGGAATPSRALP